MIDIVYSIGNLTPDAWTRFRKSYEFLKKNSSPFNVCVSEMSKESSKNELDKFLSDYKYYFHKSNDIFNPSITKNKAVEFLVTSDYFMFLDIDIIVDENFVYMLEKDFEKNDEVIICNFVRLKENQKSIVNVKEMLNKVDWKTATNHNNGLIACPTEVYKELNGFDEEYIGWGARDTDFNHRARKLGRIHFTPHIKVMHQYHKGTSIHTKEHVENNKKRYIERVRMYNNKEIPLNQIKGMKDLRQ